MHDMHSLEQRCFISIFSAFARAAVGVYVVFRFGSAVLSSICLATVDLLTLRDGKVVVSQDLSYTLP